jgi:D-glycero-D-manno-heptose 1,7-bisphosphate phosphatase
LKKKAAFLDRDGTIVEDQKYKNDHNKIKILKDAIKALLILKRLKFKLIIVTNQSGIAKKITTRNKVDTFNKRLKEILKKQKIIISKIYVCPHSESERCKCRKPKSKFAFLAKKRFNLNLKNSIVIGDKISDKLFGKKYNIKGYLLDKKTSIYDVAKRIKKKKS